MSLLRSIAAELDADLARGLLDDAAAALVREECDGEFLVAELPDYTRPASPAHRVLRREGRMRTIDGGEVSVLVHRDVNLRLWEVEFIRWDRPSSVALDWSTLSIVACPEPSR
jgi:hypothetical protein